MKTASERQWLKMSMHGKKEFLKHHEFDKKLANSQWSGLPNEVQEKFEANPVVVQIVTAS